MRTIARYFLALAPRRMIWFFVQAVALLFLPAIKVASARLKIKGADMLSGPNIIAIELGIALVVLFVSGMTTWSREREKNQDKWPHLDARHMKRISDGLGPYANFVGAISIHSNDSADCADLAAQIHDAIRHTGSEVRFEDSSRRWSPGITIAVRYADQRAAALQQALSLAIGTEVEMASSDRLEPHILIGSKPRIA